MHSFATILLALSLPLHAFASHAVNLRRHAEMALVPRQGSNARMTYYDITTGTTACGGNYGPNAFVVALDSALFGDVPGKSQFCYDTITITCNGKSATAQIVDKCPGCPPGGLDLTQGLFQFFSPLGTGVIYCDWTVGGAKPQVPTTSSPPPPPPTTHYDPPSTSQHSTYSPPPPSTSSSTSTSSTSKTSSSPSSAPPTTTQQSSSTSSTTQTSGAYNNVPASSLAQPTGSISGQNQSINYLYQAVLGMGTAVEASKS